MLRINDLEQKCSAPYIYYNISIYKVLYISTTSTITNININTNT